MWVLFIQNVVSMGHIKNNFKAPLGRKKMRNKIEIDNSGGVGDQRD
jgi:hypothetical protein